MASASRAARLLAWVRLTHPFPVLLKVLACAAFATIATSGVPSLGPLAALLIAVCLVNAGIGALNDYCDRDLDAQSKPSKPLVQGTGPALAGARGRRRGARYRPGRDPLAALARSHERRRLRGGRHRLRSGPEVHPLELGAVCRGLSAAAHLELDGRARLGPPSALGLPGRRAAGARHPPGQHPARPHRSDRRSGVQGLAHRLGPRWSRYVCWAGYLVAQALVLARTRRPTAPAKAARAGAASSAALLASAMLVDRLRSRTDQRAALTWHFRLLALAAVPLSVGWLLALTHDQAVRIRPWGK